LIQCAITYFNNGVRSGGGIGDLLSMKPFSDLTIYTARYLMDMIFYITIVLLLLNMINGVIVSTFSQIREESNNKEEDRTNKCFICSIDRVEFEKKKIAFKDHLKYEHNSKTYIKFLVFLKMIDYKDLDADQSHIIESINERDIGCFPVLKSISIGDLEDGGEGSDED
jgi:inositol 1,4,5-triphosphate receptor type 3